MKTFRCPRITLVVVATILLSGCTVPTLPWQVPHHVYLTWQGDTSHTMTVNFHTVGKGWQSVVHYDTVSHADTLSGYAFSAAGESKRIPGLLDQRDVRSVELTGLTPDTVYYFTAGGDCAAKEYSFRTCPDDNSPIRFVCGGDVDITDTARAVLGQAGALNPLFAVIGGDLAYADGSLLNSRDWDTWLKNWSELMVTTDGHLVPMVLAVGNHEVNYFYFSQEVVAPFYFGFFPQGGSSYFCRTFGENVAILVLDSSHVVPHFGPQTAWLEETLAAHVNTKLSIASYHVPLYPSHRDFHGTGSVLGRTFWLPLFDEYELDFAFEHHDHTHKRTWPLRENALAEEGTIYLGDGCIGMNAREITDPDAWYLAAASSTPHIWVADVSPDAIDIYAIDQHGNVFDAVP